MTNTQLTDEQVANLEIAVSGLGTITAYSGRNMYGTTCLGIVSNDPIRVAMYLAKNLIEMDEAPLLRLLLETYNRQDNMGKSDTVVYYPRLLMADDEYDSDDDESDYE